MTTTLTLIDNVYEASGGDGRKRLYATLSILRPSTAGGDALSLDATYFPNKFLGGRVVGINPNVSIGAAGVAALGQFRADTTSTATVIFQLMNVGVGASFGALIDNTISVQSCTVTVEMVGY